MFCLKHKTTRHSPPKMKMTFNKLGEYMRKEFANVVVKGRVSAHSIPDVIEQGAHMVMTERGLDTGLQVVGEFDARDEVEEVEDDGSLDV